MPTYKDKWGNYHNGPGPAPDDVELDIGDVEESIKKKEMDQKTRRSTRNATNSRTTRSDAKKTPKGTQTPTKEEFVNEAREISNQSAEERRTRSSAHASYEERQSNREKKLDSLGKKRGGITGLGVIGALADGALTYAGERAEDPNGSKIVDGLKAGATAAAWLLAEPVMWGITLGGAAIAGGKMLYEDAEENYDIKKSIGLHVRQDESGNKKGTLGGEVVDNEYAATSRQRQEQIMRNHKISTESILGSEARQLHR